MLLIIIRGQETGKLRRNSFGGSPGLVGTVDEPADGQGVLDGFVVDIDSGGREFKFPAALESSRHVASNKCFRACTLEHALKFQHKGPDLTFDNQDDVPFQRSFSNRRALLGRSGMPGIIAAA